MRHRQQREIAARHDATDKAVGGADLARPHERGQALLRKRLVPPEEFELRTRNSVTLWLSAAVVVISQQALPFGFHLTLNRLLIMGAYVLSAAFLTDRLYPRLSPRAFARVEQCMMVASWIAIALLILLSGGAQSPYVVIYFFSAIYCAYFWTPLVARRQIAFGSALALLPLAYDWHDAAATHLVPKLAVMLAVFAAVSWVISKKKLAMVTAELHARHLSLTDPLTGVANLRVFQDGAAEEFARATAEGGTVTVGLADLDGLKEVNTAFGYVGGDDLIRRMSQLLLAAAREQDQVARVGGDEFALLMPDASAQDAEQFEQRFDALLRETNQLSDGRPQLSACIGVAIYPEDGGTLKELMERADARMYERKSALPSRLPMPQTEGDRKPAVAESDAAPDRSDDSRVRAVAAAAAWILGGGLLALTQALPTADRSHLTGTLVMTTFFLMMAASTMLGAKRFPNAAARWSELAALAVVTPCLMVTGGVDSPVLPLVLLQAAQAAYFVAPREAAIRVGAAVAFTSWPFWAYGLVDAVTRTRFMALAFATLVVSGVLQINARKLAAAEQYALGLSEIDPLTKVANRRAFELALTSACAVPPGSMSVRPAGGLILVDLDDFKAVNGAIGHLGGNRTLCCVAHALKNAVGEGGLVCRIGGDEFAVVLREGTEVDVRFFAEHCRAAVNDTDWQAVVGHRVTISIGYATWPAAQGRWENLVIAADAALHSSKDAGKDAVSRASEPVRIDYTA